MVVRVLQAEEETPTNGGGVTRQGDGSSRSGIAVAVVSRASDHLKGRIPGFEPAVPRALPAAQRLGTLAPHGGVPRPSHFDQVLVPYPVAGERDGGPGPVVNHAVRQGLSHGNQPSPRGKKGREVGRPGAERLQGALRRGGHPVVGESRLDQQHVIPHQVNGPEVLVVHHGVPALAFQSGGAIAGSSPDVLV